MNDALYEFFRAGRRFRQRFSRGIYVVLDPDEISGPLILQWLGRGNITTSRKTSLVWEVEEHPRCIVINADGFDRQNLFRHLERIDREMPEVPEIVFSRDSSLCKEIEDTFPRLTVIRRGEGLEGVLAEMGREALVERFAG